MKGLTLRALVAMTLAGAAALLVVKTRDRRRALDAGPVAAEPIASDRPDEVLADQNLGDLATGEGMPESP
jgi:hypothetical protein